MYFVSEMAQMDECEPLPAAPPPPPPPPPAPAYVEADEAGRPDMVPIGRALVGRDDDIPNPDAGRAE